jgi:hypothetical protein
MNNSKSEHLPDWVTHVGELDNDLIGTDYLRIIHLGSGKVERVDRSDLYRMRLSKLNKGE